MSLEAAIAAQSAGKLPEEVQELVLDTCKATKVTGLEKYSNLKLLTLNGCGLTSLEGFPTLPKLQRLELSDNNLSDGLEALQEAGLVQLRFLSLAGNKFTTLDALEPLAALPNLRDLDMFTCAVTELPEYRSRLFDMFPALKYLDGFDADDNEKPDEDGDDDDDEEDDEEDDDLLDSELEASEGGEDDDDGLDDEGEEEYGEDETDDQFGEEDGEEGDLGEEGEEGESELGEETEEGEDDYDDNESEADGGDAKRQRR